MSRGAAGPVTIDLISTETDLAACAGTWEELSSRSALPNPFLRWEWVSAWHRHFGRGKELQIFLIRDEGRPIGIAPFYRKSRRALGLSFHRLSLLGDEEVGSDHLDLISEKGAERRVATAVAQRLIETPERGGFVELRGMAEHSLHLPIMIEAFQARGWTIWKERGEICPYLTLDRGWADYVEQLSPGMRATVRRKVRKLDDEPQLEFVVVQSPETAVREFDRLLELHRRRWESDGGSDAFVSDVKTPFHREVARSLFEKAVARLFLLRSGDQTVASLYGFLIQGRFFYYQAGFDPAWQDRSPGTSLMAKTLEWAMASGWREFDFLQGTDAYKFHWTGTERRNWNVSLFAPGLKNQLYRSLFSSRGLKGRLSAARRGSRTVVARDRRVEGEENGE